MQATVFIIPLTLAALHMVIRWVLMGNIWASETVFGPACEIMVMFCTALLMAMWWIEGALQQPAVG